MALIKTKNPFRNTRIAAGGGIWDALTRQHRVLTLDIPTKGISFVLAHSDDRARAIKTAAAMTDLHPYVFLITSEQFDMLLGTTVQEIAVLDGRNDLEVAGYADLLGEVFIPVPTEHGDVVVGAATVADLRKGMLFTTGEKLDSARRSDRWKLVVFRALTDFDPETGTVERHILTMGWSWANDLDKANLSSMLTGADRIINLVTDRGALLDKLELDDITEREPA